jgi:hypothetical protein
MRFEHWEVEMTIDLLSEQQFSGSGLSYAPSSAISSGFVKILATGELNGQAADRRLLLRINGKDSGYQGFVLMNGHAGNGEWDGSGYYLGRNGWHLDATFMVEFTLGISSTAQKITGAGTSTFAHGNNNILGFECHGFCVTNAQLSRIELVFTGGVATGMTRVYRM